MMATVMTHLVMFSKIPMKKHMFARGALCPKVIRCFLFCSHECLNLGANKITEPIHKIIPFRSRGAEFMRCVRVMMRGLMEKTFFSTVYGETLLRMFLFLPV